MSNQRVEIQHNDPEQVVAYVRAACEIVEQHVPDALVSPELLVKVLDLVAGKTIQQLQPAPIGILGGLPQMDIPRGGRH